jgi:hypothetical protein
VLIVGRIYQSCRIKDETSGWHNLQRMGCDLRGSGNAQPVQEEKPNSMFHQINEASYTNTKANLEYDASKETRRLQNDEILDSLPFRFIGQPETNGDI